MTLHSTLNKAKPFAILGENGAGKSTTMRMIACRSPLNSGKLLVEGFDVRMKVGKFVL
jgi:lipooligosaccharide transport system ATP-binding protein